jgi:hypothetical protein
MIVDGRGKIGLLADDHNRGADYRITAWLTKMSSLANIYITRLK